MDRLRKVEAEAEAGILLAKGEAEMKSCKAEVNVKGRMSRLGLLSLVSIMILFVSVGKTFAADDVKDFELCKRLNDGKNPGDKLSHLSSGYEKREAHKLLVDKPDLAKYALRYHDQPFKFIEGVRNALLDSFTSPDGDPGKLISDLQKGFENLSPEDIGGYEHAYGYNLLLKELAKLSNSDLQKLLRDSNFLKKLFKGDPKLFDVLRNALDLAECEKPKPTPTPTATPTALPTATPTAIPTAAPTASPTEPPQVDNREEERRRSEEAHAREEFQNRIEQQLKDMQKQAVQTTPSVIPTALPQVNPPYRQSTGELDDSALQAKQFCDKLAALQRNLADNFNTAFQPLKDLANQMFNELASANRFPNNRNNNPDKQLADTLLPLLQGNNKNQGQVQAPPAPPQSPRPPQSFGDVQPNPAFNQFPQPTPPPQEPPPPPPMYLPQLANGATTRKITLDLPRHSGRQELVDANSSIAQSQALLGRQLPQTINPFNGQQMPPFLIIPTLQSEQTKTKRVLTQAQANLQGIKDQRARLQEQLDQLKDGGRAALPSWVKQEEQRLQSEYESKKQDYESRKQFAQQAVQQSGADPMQTQQQMMREQQGVNQAKAELDKFRQQMEAKVEEGNKDIASLKSMESRLGKAEKDLQAQIGQLQDRDQQIDTNLQQEYAVLMQPPQQPAQSGTMNVNKIAQMGSRPAGGTPVGRAMNSQPPKKGGGVVRGSLGGGLGGMTAPSSGQ